MEWNRDAEESLAKVPTFVRKMVIMSAEKAAREKGENVISLELLNEVREKYFSLDKGKEGRNITKIAIVRCDTVSEVCPGTGCLKAFNNRKLKFDQYGPDTELISVFTCGGCSGRRVSRLVEKLINSGVDVIHMSSCMLMDSEYPKCPFKNQIKQSIEAKGVKVVEGTHH